MTSTQQKEMRDFRDSLEPWQQEAFDRLVKAKGEEAVYSMLGHLKAQADESSHL